MIFLRNEEKTSLLVTVRDGFTGQYVEHARVVLAQSGMDAQTDQTGMTQKLYVDDLPCSFSVLPNRIRPAWQEVCILVYHDLYVDTVVLHVSLTPGQENIIDVEIFQKNDLPGEQVVVSSKYPDDMWLEDMLAFYR